jgi:mannose-6-phosphate isomerase-like protein (cupin superfamily)
MTTNTFKDLTQDASITPPGMLDPTRRKIWTPVNKDWSIFQKYGRETSGEYTLVTLGVMPGGANAAHWHGSYSETFTPYKGSLGVYSASKGKMLLGPGESYTVPPGEAHYFFNDREEEVEVEVKLQPAREGFEKGLYIAYGMARDGMCIEGSGGFPKNPLHIAIVCELSDMWIAGMAGTILNPILKVLAWVGRKIGTEEWLVQRYWVEDGDPKKL